MQVGITRVPSLSDHVARCRAALVELVESRVERTDINLGTVDQGDFLAGTARMCAVSNLCFNAKPPRNSIDSKASQCLESGCISVCSFQIASSPGEEASCICGSGKQHG